MISKTSEGLRTYAEVSKKKNTSILNSTEGEIYHAHNVKMPTSVGILIFISMISKTSESLRTRQVCIFQYLSIYE